MSIDENFFYYNNIISTHEDELNVVCENIDIIHSLSNCVLGNLYIINYLTKKFDYVSNNGLFLCGYTSEEVRDMGYSFYYNRVPHEDLDFLIKVNKIGFDFLNTLIISERKKYTISYDFRIKNEHGKLILINHKLTPLVLTKSGKIWKAICVVTLSTSKQTGNIKLINNYGGKSLIYDLANNCWCSEQNVLLSSREKEIIQLSIRGYSIKEISEELFVSIDTIKFHRRKIFNKLNVNSMSDVILKTLYNNLI